MNWSMVGRMDGRMGGQHRAHERALMSTRYAKSAEAVGLLACSLLLQARDFLNDDSEDQTTVARAALTLGKLEASTPALTQRHQE